MFKDIEVRKELGWETAWELLVLLEGVRISIPIIGMCGCDKSQVCCAGGCLE